MRYLEVRIEVGDDVEQLERVDGADLNDEARGRHSLELVDQIVLGNGELVDLILLYYFLEIDLLMLEDIEHFVCSFLQV